MEITHFKKCKPRRGANIAELKNICDSLDIETDNFKRRKAQYNEALANVLNSCTCINKQGNR